MKAVLYAVSVGPEGLAVIIDRLPAFLRPFFAPVRRQLSKPQFGHFWAMVLSLLVGSRRGKLSAVPSVLPDCGHRTRHGAFLSESHWDSGLLLRREAERALAAMKPRKGEVLHLLIDDTRIAKRGKRMDLLSKMWDHKQQRFVRGHMVLTAAVLFRGVVLPARLELWKPKKDAGRSYRKITDMAAGLIAAFRAPAGLRVRVLFDAFYLCPAVTRAAEERGFTWFSVAARNRNFVRDNGKKGNIGSLMRGLLRHHGREVRMKRSAGRQVKLRIAGVRGRLSRIGPVHMVISKRPYEAWKTTTAFATNETGLTDREVLAVYETRWRIEVLFKELRCDLGLGDYQMQSQDGILRHLHLCGLAHLLLTRRSLEALGAKAKTANKPVELPTMNGRLSDLRGAIRDEQVNRVFGGKSHARLRRKLRKYLSAA